ncbi:MAG: hypothetical protein KGN02_01830 [bacterium]|nr:hypothetical protein [bacterium]
MVFVDTVFNIERSCAEHSLGRMTCAMFVTWQQRLLEYELRLLEAANRLALHAPAGARRIELRSIRPAVALPIDALGFEDRDGIARAILQGIEDQHAPANAL